MNATTLVSKTLFWITPNMVFDQIRKQSIESVPHAKHVGVQAISVGRGTSEARLEPHPHVFNHEGRIHAAALFSLGEAASGMAMAGALASAILAIRPAVAASRIHYLRAVSGAIVAFGTVREDPDELLRQVAKDKRVRLNVDVQFRDEVDVLVCEMAVEWHVRMK